MNARSASASIAALIAAGVSSLLLADPCEAATAAYYVSPTGSDSNAGTSAAAPFQTLERAQTAMEGSSINTTYLMGGTYQRTGILRLGPTDAGQSWLALPGQTPVLDGGGITHDALYIYSTSNITIRWLTIQNFAQNGILSDTISNVVIDSNTIKNTMSTAWSEGGIVAMHSSVNTKITHNLIQNSQYSGISADAAQGDSINNLLIDSNAVYNTCTLVYDCGAIYVYNRSTTQSNGVLINNNVVGNYGSVATRGIGLYLDDLLSNATYTNNIVYGIGFIPFTVNSGSHNTFRNNIFDINGAYQLGYYSNQLHPTAPMVGNTFTCNIVYSAAAMAAPTLWTYVGTGMKPADQKNVYWSAVSIFPMGGLVIDPQPTVANPQFVAPAAHNYAFGASNPGSACGFQPISTQNVGPLPNA